MSLTYVAPYVARDSDAGYDESNIITDSISRDASTTDASDSGTSMSDESTQTVDSSVTSTSSNEKDGDVKTEDNASQCVKEANSTDPSSTARTFSTSTRFVISDLPSPIIHAGDESHDEHTNHSAKAVGPDSTSAMGNQHLPDTIRVDQVDSVFARDLPVLSTKVGSPTRCH